MEHSNIPMRNDTAKQYRNIRSILRRVTPQDHKVVDDLLFILAVCLFILGACFSFPSCAHAETIEGYSINQWVEAIHHTEGNDNYGILSVKCQKGSECKRICANTVRNNYKRWRRTTQSVPFVLFLQRRFCPLKAVNDPSGLNYNWLKNVQWFLKEGV